MKKTLLTLLLLVPLAACGGGDAETEAAPVTESAVTQSTGAVTIVTPANGALINGNQISVTLSSTVQILPAGDMTPGSGHHHLFLNADLSPADQPVPTVPGSVVHIGTGAATYVFEDVPAGEYRLIAVVGDALHIPLQPWVVDTVSFTVQNR